MTTRIYKTIVVRSKNMKKSELMLHAAMFDRRLLDKTCTVIVVTLLYSCQISVLSALSLDFIKYKLKRSNADSFHHHLAYLPNRKLYPNIRCRCGLDTVIYGDSGQLSGLRRGLPMGCPLELCHANKAAYYFHITDLVCNSAHYFQVCK